MKHIYILFIVLLGVIALSCSDRPNPPNIRCAPSLRNLEEAMRPVPEDNGSTTSAATAAESAPGEAAPLSNDVEWTFQASGQIIGDFAVSGGLAYFYSYDGTFYALNAESGEKKWSVATRGEQVCDSIVAKDATVCFVLYSNLPRDLGDRTGPILYALDTETGNERWHVNIGQVLGPRTPLSVCGDEVCFDNGNGLFRALDLTTGHDRNFEMGGKLLAVSGSKAAVIVASADGWVHALDIATGKEKWRFKPKVAPGNAIAAEGVVLLGSKDYRLLSALAIDTGDQKWEVESSTNHLDPCGTAAGLAFAEGANGPLHAIDITSGTELWTFDTPRRAFDFQANDDSVSFRCNDSIIAVDSGTGEETWRRSGETRPYCVSGGLGYRVGGSGRQVCAEKVNP